MFTTLLKINKREDGYISLELNFPSDSKFQPYNSEHFFSDFQTALSHCHSFSKNNYKMIFQLTSKMEVRGIYASRYHIDHGYFTKIEDVIDVSNLHIKHHDLDITDSELKEVVANHIIEKIIVPFRNAENSNKLEVQHPAYSLTRDYILATWVGEPLWSKADPLDEILEHALEYGWTYPFVENKASKTQKFLLTTAGLKSVDQIWPFPVRNIKPLLYFHVQRVYETINRLDELVEFKQEVEIKEEVTEALNLNHPQVEPPIEPTYSNHFYMNLLCGIAFTVGVVALIIAFAALNVGTAAGIGLAISGSVLTAGAIGFFCLSQKQGNSPWIALSL